MHAADTRGGYGVTDSPVCASTQMFLSIGFAAVGVLGAVYSLSAAGLGLSNGPTCLWSNGGTPLEWGTPFAGGYSKPPWTVINIS